MIDFENKKIFKLTRVNEEKKSKVITDLLVPGEEVIGAYKSLRDSVFFTTKRIIAVNVQGMTGKKKDYTTMPYATIQVYSVETAGHLDMDSELELYFSGVGKIRFEFTGRSDIVEIGQTISRYLL